MMMLFERNRFTLFRILALVFKRETRTLSLEYFLIFFIKAKRNQNLKMNIPLEKTCELQNNVN